MPEKSQRDMYSSLESEDRFLDLVTDILDQLKELRKIVPAEWTPRQKEQAERSIYIAESMLKSPHTELTLVNYWTGPKG